MFPSFEMGGAQRRFATLANHWGDAFRHSVIAMDGMTDCAARLDPALAVAWPDVSIRKGDTFGNVRRFRAALRTLKPDLLVTHNWGTIEWALANVPPLLRHIHIEDGFGPEEQSRQFPRRIWMRRLLLRRTPVVVPSRSLWRIAADVWRLRERHLRYIPNGIDLARFSARGSLGGTAEAVTIGTVASLRAEKNIARLIGAFARLPTSVAARLVIVGGGLERERLESLAAERCLTDRVRFEGELGDPSGAYRRFDIFALSSDTEQMPLSILEAMASGLPVAATDVGDVREMLAAENAPFVVARDETALVAALAGLAADPALRLRLGAANRAKAERDFDEGVMLEAYRALFSRAPAAVVPMAGGPTL
ncbi:glycosyltransferase [Roseomonas sp. CAU 1739]